jgi:hypothetical protein
MPTPRRHLLGVPLLTGIVAAGAILAAVYPGFMSYDSVRALHEARTSVVGGDYPPFVSYVWRVFDLIWPGPSLMLLVQNFVLAFAFGIVVRALGYRSPTAVVAGVALFSLAPPILGPMLVVWKDVGVSACLCSAVACFLAADGAPKPRPAITTGVVLLAAGAAYRLNAIMAVVPLVGWYAWRGGFAGLARGKAFVAGGVITAGIAAAVIAVNGVRYPSLERLPPPTGITGVMIHDLVAMTALTGRPLLPAADPASRHQDEIDYFRRVYDHRHIELQGANDAEGRIKPYFRLPASDIRSAWLTALRAEPRAYLARRTAVFRELVGFTDGRTFMATHPGVDPNDEGVMYRPTRLSNAVVDYVWRASATPVGKPWFYYALGAAALAIALLRQGSRERAAALAVAASGFFYLLPLYFVTPAADVRYNHWSIVCALIVVAIAARPPPARRAGA